MSNNKYLELPEATDEESNNRRNFLIGSGIISKNNIRKEKIEMAPEEIRKNLISSGVIKPVEKVNGKVTYCSLPPKTNVKSTNNEEGEYRVKPIVSDDDYNRRKMVYFRSLQELLFARQHLNLIVGKKEDKDPDWFF